MSQDKADTALDQAPQGVEMITKDMLTLSEHMQKAFSGLSEMQDNAPQHPESFLNFLSIGEAFFSASMDIFDHPESFIEATERLTKDSLSLWNVTFQRFQDFESDNQPVIAPSSGDKRFKNKIWNQDPSFDFLKQSYLLYARWVNDIIDQSDVLTDDQVRKVRFYSKQMVDAFAPNNFALTNPDVLTQTLSSNGENLLRGFAKFLEDFEQGRNILNIENADANAFKIGENIATTPGKVIYRNELMELIQYCPSTEKVFRVPLLIVPAWINKYYIFDLQDENSLVKWLVSKGFTVFIISWVNPDGRHIGTTFEDYMTEGPLAAAEVIKAITGEPQINVAGYCLGGILLSTMMGYLGRDAEHAFKSVSLLTTLIDFSKAGELLLFTDQDHFKYLEKQVMATGYLDGATMSATFNMLRANDLIWSAFINNYLMAKDPPQFDLLYWNADATNLPGDMFKFYVREMFQENNMQKPGGISIFGQPVDLTKVSLPSFVLGTREDHIAPWESTYPATQLFEGACKFVLSGSGHVAGVINPPKAEKYGFWTNNEAPEDPQVWLEQATHHAGSWWNEWNHWLQGHSLDMIDAEERNPESNARKALAEAPGEYVLKRA
ncbi:MAG: PHA/PHB synthase family protein [Alphaproteobacteria bacterium]